MSIRLQSCSLALVAMLFASCDSRTGNAAGTQPGAQSLPLTLGPAGGVIRGPNGSQAILPAGALTRDTRVELMLAPVGSTPPLPARIATVGATYALGPRDLLLVQPATVSIPFDPEQLPRRAVARLIAADADAESWHEVAAAYVTDGRINGSIPAASRLVIVVSVESLAP